MVYRTGDVWDASRKHSARFTVVKCNPTTAASSKDWTNNLKRKTEKQTFIPAVFWHPTGVDSKVEWFEWHAASEFLCIFQISMGDLSIWQTS